ncbi:MAG: hypothetical protein IJH47_01420 [Oscillospiraceae bacterium]|nr:hypothetical protein [Oscillospiraceae bacterium]
MRKTLSALLTLVLMLSLFSVSALAATRVKNHEHTLDEGTVTQEPTCYTRGWITYVCTDPDCDYVCREAIPATGHNLDDGAYLVVPTCSGMGEMIYHCQNPGCTYLTTHIVPYLGHRMELDEVISEPSCTHPGLTRYVCAREGCHAATIIDFPSLGHRLDEGVLSVEPTCTSSGSIVYSCTREGCDYTKTQWVAPLPHTWDEGTITIEPTEHTWGRRIYTCTVCGATTPVAVPPLSAIFRLALHSGVHYSVDPDMDTTIRSDGELNFQIIFDDGWIAGDDFAVTANNAQIRQEDDGTFTICHVEADTRVSVTGIVRE